MPDLYKILKVNRSASIEEIKASYRKLAMKYHPDRNPGCKSAEAKFKEVQHAWEVLSDPERRARYDATGETDQKILANETAAIAGMLSDLLLGTLKRIEREGKRAQEIDLVGDMQSTLLRLLTEIQQHRREMAATKKPLEALLGRFTTEDGQENILDWTIRQQIEMIDRKLQDLDGKIKQTELVKKALGKYAFRFDAVGEKPRAGRWMPVSPTGY